MVFSLRIAVATASLLTLISGGGETFAQKPGGVLKIYHFDSPASLSLHEEVTYAALGPAMGLFNNLVVFDQHVPQASLQSIVPDLAAEWSWDPSKTELSFRLRGGVKMARRQAVYRQGREVHEGYIARQIAREVSPQSAQSL